MSEGERRRWEARWEERRERELPPAAWFVIVADRFPAPGRALDWAGGDGRHAIWLAELGWRVTVADIAPNALAIARERAERRGVAIETALLDLERDPPPAGPWDLILCHHYLDRSLPVRVAVHLAPGGILAWVQQTVRNLERNPRPPRRYLLEEGEMRRLLAPLEIVLLEEGWSEEGRHEARALARRPAASPPGAAPPRVAEGPSPRAPILPR
jgi:2-polyprenyl-3-methyl-5-hydroxy-6-metoxy-1,4-benzoquinol methylase